MAILYSFRRCPYAIRARMMLKAGKAQYEHREILLKKKPSCLLRFSTKGTIPVWIINNQVIDESMDIVMWCLKQLPLCQKLQLSHQQHSKALALIQQNDNPFKKALDSYKYHPVQSPIHQQAWKDCQDYLTHLNNQINDSFKLFGECDSFADYALFPFVRQCYLCNKEQFAGLKLKKIEKWLEKLISSHLFEKVMEKYPLYEET